MFFSACCFNIWAINLTVLDNTFSSLLKINSFTRPGLFSQSMWFPDFPDCQQKCALRSPRTAVFYETLVWQKRVLKAFAGVVHFFSAYKALLFVPLCCFYQRNKTLYAILLYFTEQAIKSIILSFVSFGLCNKNAKKKKMDFPLFTRQNQVVWLFVCVYSLRGLCFGKWRQKRYKLRGFKTVLKYWQQHGAPAKLMKTMWVLYAALSIEWSRIESTPYWNISIYNK